MLKDYLPLQQGQATVDHLADAALEVLRNVAPQELANGGNLYGRHLDPVTYIVACLPLQAT